MDDEARPRIRADAIDHGPAARARGANVVHLVVEDAAIRTRGAVDPDAGDRAAAGRVGDVPDLHIEDPLVLLGGRTDTVHNGRNGSDVVARSCTDDGGPSAGDAY